MSCLVDWVGRPTLDVAALGSGQWSQLEERLSDEFISVQMARVFLKITRSCDSSHLVSSCLGPKVTVQAQGFRKGLLTLSFRLFFLVPSLQAFQPEAESLGEGQASTARWKDVISQGLPGLKG